MLSKKVLGATAAKESLYVEDVFNTFLTTGAGSAITVVNDVDLSGEGGLVWTKTRNTTGYHVLFDTARGADKGLYSNTTDAQATNSNWLSFNNNGFTIGTTNNLSTSSTTGVSWSFRKAPKFFDVVTYTGNGSARTIAHNLGSAPGMMIIKAYGNMGGLGNVSDWQVYHRSIGADFRLVLNATTQAINIGAACWNSTDPTASVFSLGTNTNVNANGVQYVAYLFAHDAGGFGAAGTDNIISCGSFTASGSGGGEINLGYEPQFVMIKRTDSTSNWQMLDTMRGYDNTDTDAALFANSSSSESFAQLGTPFATGFREYHPAGTYIYMAIRRPMKTPTSGTDVFSPVAYTTNNSSSQILSLGFNADMVFTRSRTATSSYESQGLLATRLIGTKPLRTTQTAGDYFLDWGKWDVQNSVDNALMAGIGTQSAMLHGFRRATGFFDVVCYTGDSGAATDKNHNLGVVPELIIMKRRNTTGGWIVWRTATGTGNTWGLLLNTTAAEADQGTPLMSALPTSTTFKPALYGPINSSGNTFVAYLFASVAGVSKVGSYTGNGSNQTINCGFTAGARFVLIKRTDSTGDWVTFDTARGIVSGNDPFLQLNTTDAEVTGEDAVDPTNSGFIVNETTEALNTNNATYIYLAIA